MLYYCKELTSIVYSNVELKNKISEINHPSVRACLEYKNIFNGLEIHYDGDLPARSGIGSSSSFTVGLLKALSCYKNETISNVEIAKQAIFIEQNKLNESVGVQDQIMAASGGYQIITIDKENTWKTKNILLSNDYIKELESYILFGFSGISRLADKHAKKKIENIKNKKTDNELHKIMDIAKEAKVIFESMGDIKKIGALLNQSWQEKKKLANGVTNNYIDDIYNVALSKGAFGGKLMGAGGGGFFFFVAPPKYHKRIKDSLPAIKVWVPFKVYFNGSTTILGKK